MSKKFSFHTHPNFQIVTVAVTDNFSLSGPDVRFSDNPDHDRRRDATELQTLIGEHLVGSKVIEKVTFGNQGMSVKKHSTQNWSAVKPFIIEAITNAYRKTEHVSVEFQKFPYGLVPSQTI